MDTFLVRVWTPAGGEPSAGLRGTVRHLSSGAETPFSDPEALLTFLRDAAVEHAGEPPASQLSLAVEPRSDS
jgi:hypothetical protein